MLVLNILFELFDSIDLELGHQRGVASAETVGPEVFASLPLLVGQYDLMNALLGHLEGITDCLVGETLITELCDLLD